MCICYIIHVHRPEFIAPKGFTEEAYSFLFKENWTFGIYFYEQHDDREEPGEEQHSDRCREEYVYYSFDDQIIMLRFQVGPQGDWSPWFPLLLLVKNRRLQATGCTAHADKDWFLLLAPITNFPCF